MAGGSVLKGMKQMGVTLVELLVVLAVMGILAALVVPSIGKSREKGRTAACLANLRHLGVALNLYLGEHNLTMPTLAVGRRDEGGDNATIDTVLADYAESEAAFRCPSDPGIWQAAGTSYFWNPALNGQRANALDFLGLTDSAIRIPVLSDKEGWHQGGGPEVNILYADGHVTNGLNLSLGN